MRIVIESSVLDDKKTGVARFLMNIMEVWTNYYNYHEYIILRKKEEIKHIKGKGNFKYIVIPWFQKRNMIWQQLVVPKIINEVGADVYFAPNYTLPLLLKVPVILAIHDISFFHYRSSSILKNLLIKYLVNKSYKIARKVIVPSYFIKDELIKYIGKDLDKKVDVIYAAHDNFFLKDISINYVNEVKRKYGIIGDYILNIGLIFNRRYPSLLIKAFNEILKNYNREMSLVIIGENRTDPYLDIDGLIDKLDLRGKVVRRDYISEDELHALYKGCSAFIYLSDYEGFGMPILEALSMNKPVICSNIDVFKELYEGACYFVDNREEDIIASKIMEAMSKPIKIDNIKRCVSKFSWKKSADELMKIIESWI